MRHLPERQEPLSLEEVERLRQEEVDAELLRLVRETPREDPKRPGPKPGTRREIR